MSSALRRPRLAPLLALLVVLPLALHAQEPAKPKREVKQYAPRLALAGKPAVIRLIGQDLAPREVTVESGAGIPAKLLKTEPATTDADKANGNTVVEVEVTAKASAKPGSYTLKLVHESGDSPTARLYVDEALPDVAEQEPNNSLRKPQVLPPGPVAVAGKLDGDGCDVFRFEGRAGETWRVEVLARRLGSEWEPCLRLRGGPRLAPLKVAVDRGDDCALQYKLPADGPYLVELFDGDNRADAKFTYRLTLRPVGR